MWISLIDMLKKKDNLPVVAFTFSKKKIEENAGNLLSVDLLTASEKSEVHIFFHKCIHRLRGNDKHLPQVFKMCSSYYIQYLILKINYTFVHNLKQILTSYYFCCGQRDVAYW